jgi:hypothetical protein
MDACGLPTTPPRTRLLVTLAAAALAGLAFAAASSARGMGLPSPCPVLSAAHAQSLTASATASVSPGKLKTYGSGTSEQVTCNETVGTISVYLSYFNNVGGSGGVRITRQSHPAGFGGTATLTVGTGAGNGAPVDYITFHKGTLYADLSANGGEPSKLTTLGQEVYKLTP